jgi:HemY protein
MIRAVVFLLVVGILAFAAVWLADRPGEIAITWLGLRIETSVMVAAVAVAGVAVTAVMLWSLLRFVLRSPHLFALALRERRRRRGYRVITSGLLAVGAGDARMAQRFAAEAQRLAPSDPLALLLRAQTAQLRGDRAEAERAFRDMAERGDTKMLGLRGLYVEAQRRDDAVAARVYAEAAVNAGPMLGWARQAALEFRCASGDWAGALAVLDNNYASGSLDRATYRRQRAVLLTARALAAAETDRDTAKALALDAVKLAPDLIPAAALAGRLLAEGGEHRKASKILEAAWRASPHPDLAETYAHVRLADSARDRLARVEALSHQLPGHVEGALAVARAAIDAREFAVARAALEPLVGEPTQRIALLMAELEETEHGDEGRAREWMARALRAARDPAWTADGFVSDRWLPVSPVTGRLDAFQWRVPLTELEEERRLIDVSAQRPALAEVPASPAEAGPVSPKPPSPLIAPAPPEPEPAIAQSPKPASRRIIPIMRAPDDPGPEPETQAGLPFWQRLFLR